MNVIEENSSVQQKDAAAESGDAMAAARARLAERARKMAENNAVKPAEKREAEPEQEQATAQEQNPEPEPEPEQKTIATFRVIKDNQEMEVEFQRSGPKTLPPVYEELIEQIQGAGVKYGINEARIKQLCERPIYGVPFNVAKGKRETTGADGRIVFLINTSQALKPTEKADGTVDFRDLGFVRTVVKGQELCEIYAPEIGEDGFDIYGTLLPAKVGKTPVSPVGKNTELNEDGTRLIASCDGSAEFKNGIISIIDSLKIDGNVDNSTGDINFLGDVVVTGDVVSGFRVIARGSVTVKGSVEGATIQAGGDIIVNQGINGMGRGSLVAGGMVRCKYIQGCYIKTGADIYAESIMYCNIECFGNLVLSGKKSRLIGGRTSVVGYLETGLIGSDSHTTTHITMCATNTDRKQQINQLVQHLRKIDDDELKISQIVARYEDLRQKGKLKPEMEESIALVANSFQAVRNEREKTQAELESIQELELRESHENSQNSYIKCKGYVYEGVTLSFGPLVMQVQQRFLNSRIGIIGTEIAVSPL